MTAERAPLNIETLAQVIQSERVELMQIQAMLRCLSDVLTYSDDDNASMHADVAILSAKLLKECIERLEQLVAALMCNPSPRAAHFRTSRKQKAQ